MKPSRETVRRFAEDEAAADAAAGHLRAQLDREYRGRLALYLRGKIDRAATLGGVSHRAWLAAYRERMRGGNA